MADSSAETVAVAHPPRELLLAAAGSVLVGAALLTVSGTVANLVGYFLSSFVTIGFVAAYQRVDVSRRNRRGYEAQPWLRRLMPAITALGVAVAAIHVWRIATEIAG